MYSVKKFELGSDEKIKHIYIYIHIQRRDCKQYDGIKVERPVQRMKKNQRDSTQEKERHGMRGLSQPSYSTV